MRRPAGMPAPDVRVIFLIARGRLQRTPGAVYAASLNEEEVT